MQNFLSIYILIYQFVKIAEIEYKKYFLPLMDECHY